MAARSAASIADAASPSPESSAREGLGSLAVALGPVAVRAGPVADFGARYLDSAVRARIWFSKSAVPAGGGDVNVAGAAPLGKLPMLDEVTGVRRIGRGLRLGGIAAPLKWIKSAHLVRDYPCRRH